MLKQTLRSKLFYNALGSFYDNIILSTGYKNAVKNFIQNLNFPKKELRIMDAGCGTGLVTFSLLSKFNNMKITAFDYSKDMLKAAEKTRIHCDNEDVKFHWGNIESINPLIDLDDNKVYLEENSFDYIFVSGALEYVDMEKGVRELVKYLKKDGIFVNIAVRNNICGKLIGKLMGFRPYTKEQIINALKEASLNNINEIPIIKRSARLCKLAVSGVKL